MRISSEVAHRVIQEKIADPLRLTVERAAVGICQVVNEKMVNGILDMTVRRGVDPRELVIITGGGATSIPVARLAQELGIDVPTNKFLLDLIKTIESSYAHGL